MRSLLSLALALSTIACSARGGNRSPDGTGYCCPASPQCACSSLGGYVGDPEDCASMTRVCDAHPSAWIAGVDDHGCTRYRIGSSSASCNPPPPAPDAAVVDDAGPDIAPAGDGG